MFDATSIDTHTRRYSNSLFYCFFFKSVKYVNDQMIFTENLKYGRFMSLIKFYKDVSIRNIILNAFEDAYQDAKNYEILSLTVGIHCSRCLFSLLDGYEGTENQSISLCFWDINIPSVSSY